MDDRRVELDRASLGLTTLAPKLITGGLIAAAAGFGTSIVLALVSEGGVQRALQSYLVSFAYFLTISLGALFFVILQHLVRAGWSVTVRRLAEATAMNLPLLALLVIPVVLGLKDLYHWAEPGAASHDALIAWKRPYLNLPFFVIRMLIYFGLWSWIAWSYWSRSVRQDQSGDVRLTVRMERGSGPAMVVFALTVNFAAFDLLMSLDPHWYSTIFGVYAFAGGILGWMALLSIAVPLLQRSGRLGHAVTDEHYHDLGKLVFAFSVFWAYIAFSQYMLIWYANIPEETGWFLKRQTGDWTGMSLLLLFGHFLLPFLLLMPRFVKRRPKLFGPIAAWVLFMHYADIYWIVQPEFSAAQVPVSLLDLTCPLGMAGLLVAATASRLRSRSLVPEKDPRLEESLTFENA